MEDRGEGQGQLGEYCRKCTLGKKAAVCLLEY